MKKKAQETLEKAFREISYDNIKTEQEQKFKQILQSKIYSEVLKVFNCKSLSTSTGRFCELDNNVYRDFIIRQIKGQVILLMQSLHICRMTYQDSCKC